MKRLIIAGTALVSLSVGAVAESKANPGAEPKSLPVGTCVNMGNSLEPMVETGWGGAPITEADFQRIKEAGFDTVRLPVRWHNKSDQSAPYTVDPEWMDRVQEVVDWALAHQLNVILNSHHFDPIHEDPLGVSEWHGGVWKQIAERFADYPEDRLWFELENEPHNKFDHSNLIQTLAPALTAVRETNPTRAVIYGGENWSGIDSLATLPLPDDPNIYPTFHYYDPFPFTHQGASWVEPEPPAPGRKFGSKEDMEQLAQDVAKLEAYIDRTGLVPFMGETGAYDKHVSTKERAEYHRTVRKAFAPTGTGICVWGYANTFPFYDLKGGKWLEGMLDALGLPEPGYVRPTSGTPAPAAVEQGKGKKPAGRRLSKGLEDFESQLPGWLISDPTSLGWTSYGEALQTESVQDPTIPGGGAAVRYKVRKAGDSWSAAANIPLIANVEEGRRVVIGFWARSLGSDAPDGSGQVTVRFQQDAEPYPGFGDRTLSIGSDWQFYEVSAIADRTIRRAKAIVAIQFGARVQELEIGQAIALAGATSIAPR